jgi:hypothetical protein
MLVHLMANHRLRYHLANHGAVWIEIFFLLRRSTGTCQRIQFREQFFILLVLYILQNLIIDGASNFDTLIRVLHFIAPISILERLLEIPPFLRQMMVSDSRKSNDAIVSSVLVITTLAVLKVARTTYIRCFVML